MKQIKQMNMMKKIILLCLISLLNMQIILAEELIDRIVAVVEEDVVLESELQSALNKIRLQFRQSNTNMPPEDILKKQVLESLVVKKLQLDRAEATGIRVNDTEVDRYIAQIAQQNNLSVKQLADQLANEGINFSSFRKDISDQLIIQNLQRRVVANEVQVTDTEIEIALTSDNNQGEYLLSHILIALPQAAIPEQITEAKEKAEAIYQELVDGLDFKKAAISYSDSQNALQGGDLGWRPLDQIPTIFANLITNMNNDDVSKPIRSPSGFHIVKLVDKRSDSKKLAKQAKARHILIEISELMDDATANEKIIDLRSRIIAGEDFSTLAKEVSDDKISGPLGGELNWFTRGTYGQKIDEILDTLTVNQLSEPFRTSVGWHIIELLGRRESDVTDEYQRKRASESIQARKAEEAVELWVRQLRSEAFVEYRI